MDQDLFTAPAGDWGTAAVDSLSAPGTILSSVIGQYNLAFSAIAGFMMFYLLVRSVFETAHHGQVMGKANALWFTPRLVMTIALITPLPPNMYNFGEDIVLWAWKAGLANGSNTWSTAVTAAANMQPLVQGVPPQVGTLAENLFNLEFCMAAQNVTHSFSNSALITESNPPAYIGPGRMVISYDGDPAAGGVAGQCGQIVFSTSNNQQSAAAQQDGAPPPMNVDFIFNAHVTATRNLQLQMRYMAQRLVMNFLPPYAGVIPDQLMTDVATAEHNYSSAVSAAAQSMITSQNQDLSAFQTAATNGGMVKAGAWAINLMTANETVQSAVGAVPSVTPPRYEWWSDEVYAGQRAAMAGARIWWEEHYAVAQANTSAAAYSATAEKTTGEMAKIESILGPSRIKALFDNFLLGYSCSGATDTSSAVCSSGSQSNPIAEMSSLGDGLIKAAWGSIIALSTAEAVSAAADRTAEMAAIAGSSIPILGAGVGATSAIAAAPAVFIHTFLSTFSPMLWFLIFEMFGAGIMLTYILPLTPALVWFYAIARYFMSSVMTVAGANLWAIAHLEMDGEGVGQRATPGWLMILGLLVRPSMMVFALVVGLAVYTLLGRLFGLVYFEMVSNNLVGGVGGLTGLLTYVVIGGIAIATLCGICMWGVGEGVDMAMRLVGEHLHRSGDPVQDAQGTGQKGNLGGDLKQGAIASRNEAHSADRQSEARAHRPPPSGTITEDELLPRED